MLQPDSIHFSSERDNWETPQNFFDKLNEEFGFTLDVCAEDNTAKCEKYYTKKDDAFTKEWKGVCWMNPPYGRGIGVWLKKAYETSQNGSTIVCLIPSRTDTKWWHDYIMKSSEIRFVKGRLKFDGHKNSAPFPSAVVVFKKLQHNLEKQRFSSYERED